MEWLVLLACVAIAAALVALPTRSASGGADAEGGVLLAEERRMLLAELRELNEDATAGRISAADRLEGRRTLAPRLRAVTEVLHSRGELNTAGGRR